MGASSSSTVSYGDPVVSRFGLLVTTQQLDEQGWLTALGELMRAGQEAGMTGAAEGGALEGEAKEAALAWAGRHGGLTLRTVAMYARFWAQRPLVA